VAQWQDRRVSTMRSVAMPSSTMITVTSAASALVMATVAATRSRPLRRCWEKATFAHMDRPGYDADLVLWAEYQADALRRAAIFATNLGTDWANSGGRTR
jgi:hypothetical protein